MKRWLAAGFLMMFGAIANADGDFPEDEINLGEEVLRVDTVFTPKGYDINDDIRVFVSGSKPSPCFGTPFGVVERIGSELKITVKAKQKATKDRLCIALEVPFLEGIKVKDVPAGTYDVHVNPDTFHAKTAKLEITPSVTDSIDDFLYPAVERITVNPKTRLVRMIGTNPSKCLQLEKMIHTSNGVNTYAIMAIMEKRGNVCEAKPDPFVYTYQLPHDLHAEKLLVHIRTLDGLWKNEVFSPEN